MNDILSLATRLRSLTDAQLGDLLRLRAVTGGGIRDFFDLAEALLTTTSVQSALSHLDRPTLAVLATADQLGTPRVADVANGLGEAIEAVTPRLQQATALMLAEETADGEVTVYSTVAEQLRAWPIFGVPSPNELTDTSHRDTPIPVSEKDRRTIDKLGAERAFTATTIITTLLLELERGPARELAKGGISLPDRKRLATAISTDLDAMPHFMAVAEKARMVALDNGLWLTTETGNSWLLDPTPARWRTLAEGWLSSLPAEIRSALHSFSHSYWGDALRSHLGWLYPAGAQGLSERILAVTRSAELLGITANDAPSSAGALLLSGNPTQAEDALTSLLPAEVERVYVQHDLSVVAPGPLTPEVDAQLRLIADVESRALAATYRVSASSINRALAAGETAPSILSLFTRISLTGIPQPLDYLIAECADRYGLVRVGETSTGESSSDVRTYVHSEDTNLLRTIEVDHNLAALGLTKAGPRLLSRFGRDTVFWALSDARYPVAAEDSTGKTVAVQRKSIAAPPRVTITDRVLELVQQLRVDAENSDSDMGSNHAWLIKQLDAAVRTKSALAVTVTMPGGAPMELHLEPTSVASGRLRARDLNSDSERTLPLSSIASIQPLH